MYDGDPPEIFMKADGQWYCTFCGGLDEKTAEAHDLGCIHYTPAQSKQTYVLNENEQDNEPKPLDPIRYFLPRSQKTTS